VIYKQTFYGGICTYLSELRGLEVKKDGYFENFGKLGRIKLPNTISFINSKKYLEEIDENISCIVCNESVLPYLTEKNIGIVLSNEPRNTFYDIYYQLFIIGYFTYPEKNISEKAYISSRAVVADSGVVIGDNCIIEDNVIIHKGTILGDNVVVRSNSIIGGEGFEVATIRGIRKVVPHSGYCIIKSNVEIMNNTCVCKGLFRGYDTIISENVKVDNFVHVSHGVKIGMNTEVAGGTFISGNTEIGENSWIGPNVTISNGLKIGSNVRINIGAVLINDLADGESVSGNFAYDHRKFLKDFITKKLH